MENYSGSVIITQEKSVLQKTAHSHIQKEETQKLIRRKLAVGWKLKMTQDNMPEIKEIKNSTLASYAVMKFLSDSKQLFIVK